MCSMCWMMVPFGVFGAVVVIGGIAAVVVVVARLARGPSQPAQSAEMPVAILKRRYAQGEVSSEQFEAAKRQLSEGDDRKGG